MLLKALPLAFVLAGLALYTVLAGADFGAGFWQLFAGRGERAAADPRARPPLDGAGVGSQPRLADLRPDRVLDLLPTGVRLDRLDPGGAAVHRRAGDHPPGRRLRAPRRCLRAPASRA